MRPGSTAPARAAEHERREAGHGRQGRGEAGEQWIVGQEITLGEAGRALASGMTGIVSPW